MTEIIQSYKSSTSKCAVLCAGAVASLLLLSATVRSQEQSGATSLAVGQRISREMRAGEEHTYQVTLSAGQYARVVVEQKGIDVVLALPGADGKPLLEVDNNLSGTRGLETVSLLAEVSGVHRLTVRSLGKNAAPGPYEVWMEDLRTATEADRKRVTAERSYVAGAKLLGERTNESRHKAIERYEEALRLMREVGDRRGEAMTLTNIGMVYNLLREHKKALEYLDQAITVWRAVGDRHLEAITLTLNGSVFYAQ